MCYTSLYYIYIFSRIASTTNKNVNALQISQFIKRNQETAK